MHTNFRGTYVNFLDAQTEDFHDLIFNREFSWISLVFVHGEGITSNS